MVPFALWVQSLYGDKVLKIADWSIDRLSSKCFESIVPLIHCLLIISMDNPPTRRKHHWMWFVPSVRLVLYAISWITRSFIISLSTFPVLTQFGVGSAAGQSVTRYYNYRNYTGLEYQNWTNYSKAVWMVWLIILKQMSWLVGYLFCMTERSFKKRRFWASLKSMLAHPSGQRLINKFWGQSITRLAKWHFDGKLAFFAASRSKPKQAAASCSQQQE